MKNMRWAMKIVGGSVAMFLAGCDVISPVSYRYRMTVEVETPEGMRRGSSVMEIRSSKEPFQIGDSNRLKNRLIGEAVAVDTPRGTLFALIGNTTSGRPLMDVVTYALIERPRREMAFWHAVKELGQRDHTGKQAELPSDQYPQFVRFRDIKDPRTVEIVDPSTLSASFGQGIRLQRVTVQITDDPVIARLGRRLPWLDQYYDKMFDGSRINNSRNLANILSQIDFQQGVAR